MNKLFENDSYLTRFTARVLSCAQGKKGYDVTLDQTPDRGHLHHRLIDMGFSQKQA